MWIPMVFSTRKSTVPVHTYFLVPHHTWVDAVYNVQCENGTNLYEYVWVLYNVYYWPPQTIPLSNCGCCGGGAIVEQSRSSINRWKCKTFRPRRSSSVTMLHCNWRRPSWSKRFTFPSVHTAMWLLNNCPTPYPCRSNEPLPNYCGCCDNCEASKAIHLWSNPITTRATWPLPHYLSRCYSVAGLRMWCWWPCQQDRQSFSRLWSCWREHLWIPTEEG